MMKQKIRKNFPLNELRDNQTLYLNINTTPLIDVLLVLIIMIIITMPIQLHKLDLNVGKESGTELSEEKKTVVIDLKSDDTVSINGEPIGKFREEIRQSLEKMYIDYPGAILELNVDSKTKYSSVVKILSEAVRVGFTSLGLPALNKESK